MEISIERWKRPAATGFWNPRSLGWRVRYSIVMWIKAACWIESVDSGWLFLLPRGENEAATLIAVGDMPGALLGQSRVIAGLIGIVEGPAAEFAAYPRIADPLCGDGWLACGAAAIGFDPLCGEGTGNAARQAYLATAIIAAIRKGEPVEDLVGTLYVAADARISSPSADMPRLLSKRRFGGVLAVGNSIASAGNRVGRAGLAGTGEAANSSLGRKTAGADLPCEKVSR